MQLLENLSVATNTFLPKVTIKHKPGWSLSCSNETQFLDFCEEAPGPEIVNVT